VKLYAVTIEYETSREAEIIRTEMWMAENAKAAEVAAFAYISDAYDVAEYPPPVISSTEVTGEFAPIRFAVLNENGLWREAETNRPLYFCKSRCPGA
jgi:hypothetical protein